MPHGSGIGKRIILAISISTKCLLAFFGQVEWLAGIAQAQQPQGEASPSYLQVCSCAELDLLNKEPFLVLSCSPQSLSPPNIRKPRERFRDSACNQDPECLWSKRFIETKARLQGAQSQQRTLQQWHSEILGGCGQDTSYDSFYFNYLNGHIERTRKEVALAERVLEQLREEFRRTGQPAGWERSKLALQPRPSDMPLSKLQTQSEAYWLEQLSQVDLHYGKMINALQAELFELVQRRPAQAGEDTSLKEGVGNNCVPRFVYEIDKLIKRLTNDKNRDKSILAEEAIRQGALPGWFR